MHIIVNYGASSIIMSVALLITVMVCDSSVKGAGSDEEQDEVNMKNEIIVDDDKVMGWAKVCLIYQVARIPSDGLALTDRGHNFHILGTQ